MPKRRKSRLYTRNRGGVNRFYVDLRDLGGGREALIPEDETVATSDPDVAQELAAQRVRELELSRRNKTLIGVERQSGLAAFAAHHLEEKARAGKVTDAWLEQTERQLRVAVEFFGADRDLAGIRVEDAQKYAAHLKTLPSGRGERLLSTGSQRHYLNSLSNLYRRAIAEGYTNLNPVAGMLEKPTGNREEARWLEVHEASLLLEGARTFKPNLDRGALPFIYPLLATFLLTGGREEEVLGLEVDDVSLRRKTVTFRPNEFRRLKTSTSHRTVPLWPQLEEILAQFLMDRERSGGVGRLLFPSPKTAAESMVTDTRKALDRIGERTGWQKGEIRTKIFRHTFCAAALQLLDKGGPISPWTVAKWMGHGGRSLVDRVYGHLGDVRHRSEVVEFRVENHREQISEKLTKLRTG